MEKLQSLFLLSRRDSAYEQLTEDSSCVKCSRRRSITAVSRVTHFFQFTTVILLLIIIILSTTLLVHFEGSRSGVNYRSRVIKSCGSTVAEARSRDCHFDLLAKAWLPDECSRHGLDGFIEAGAALNNGTAWKYWTSEDGSMRIAEEDLAAMGENNEDRRWWTTRREHSVHCAWMLLRLAHAYTHGLQGDHLVRSYHHAEHCVDNLLKKSQFAPGQEEIATDGNIIFGDCY